MTFRPGGWQTLRLSSWTCTGAGGERYMMYWRGRWPVHVYRPAAAYDPFSEHTFSARPIPVCSRSTNRNRRKGQVGCSCSSCSRRAQVPTQSPTSVCAPSPSRVGAVEGRVISLQRSGTRSVVLPPHVLHGFHVLLVALGVRLQRNLWALLAAA